MCSLLLCVTVIAFWMEEIICTGVGGTKVKKEYLMPEMCGG